MTEISELVRVFSRYLVAQAELARCRATASGNVDYYSFGYAADMHQAEQLLAQALDDYIGHRVAVELKQLRVPAAQPLPVA